MFIFAYEAVIMAGILFSSYYIFSKALNYHASISYKVICVLLCIVLSLLFATNPFDLPLPAVRPLICVTSIIFVFALAKLKLDVAISAFLFSFGISYFLHYIAAFTVSVLTSPFVSSEYVNGVTRDANRPLYFFIYTLISVLQLFLAFLFFRIKRFKHGFPFLLKKYAVIVTLIVAGFILVFVTWIKVYYENDDVFSIPMYFFGILIIGSGVIIGIRRGITVFYRRWAKKNNDELHAEEIAEKDREIQHLREKVEVVMAANHSINHRLAASERIIMSMLDSELPAEQREHLSAVQADIQRLSREYNKKIDQVKTTHLLPTTNIPMIDALFEQFAERFASCEIDFGLNINGSITHMVKQTIDQSRLETLIGDHLQDALIAVNASDSPTRSVLVILGSSGDYYEFAVHDSGIPFEVETLTRLGTERVTTHSDTGGSGIGFMTTFQTMREYGASLIIREEAPGNPDFKKSVTIRFDRKNQYCIETYRPEAFPRNDRYTVIGRVK